MIKLLVDHQRAVLDGLFVPISAGVFIPDLKADLFHQLHNWSSSGQVLVRYAQEFGSMPAFGAFVDEFIGKASGTALNGRLTWGTP